jgi:hypothetical protein
MSHARTRIHRMNDRKLLLEKGFNNQAKKWLNIVSLPRI